MRFSCLLIVSTFFASVFVCLAISQNEIRLYHVCSGDRYTSNNLYQKNLNTLLSSLSSKNDINYGFYNFSEGQGTDRVNAVALCRGDVSKTACQGCVSFATTDLPQQCPSQYEGIVWYDYCMLRYSNKSIFQSLEQPALFTWNVKSVSDVKLFSERLVGLLSKLRIKASSGDSRIKFAVGNTIYANSTKIYGLVQCMPYLNNVECSNCLDKSFTDLTSRGMQDGKVIGASCNSRYDINQFYQISSPPPSPAPPPRANSSPPTSLHNVVPLPPSEGRSKLENIAILLVSTVSIMILIVCIFIIFRKRTQKLGDALQLDFETIRVATNNFSDDNKLGQGGFGYVYKGRLADGQEIAVKRLATGSGQGDLEFENEVVLVAKLQHRNLVKLLGYAIDGQERLLIYEFVANASLDKFLFDHSKRANLSWERRYEIIGGVARGLLYLHEDSRLRIIHRDLKASNILLDEKMHPRIADFGMARLFNMDQIQGSTSRIVGTYGYMAPEYVMHGQISVKSDVFSFGVLLLELVSGQKNSHFRNGQTVEDLISYTWNSWRAGSAADIIDPIIINAPTNEIMRCIHIGLLCVQENANARPTMISVVVMLENSLTLPLPTEPAFYVCSSVEPVLPILAEES